MTATVGMSSMNAQVGMKSRCESKHGTARTALWLLYGGRETKCWEDCDKDKRKQTAETRALSMSAFVIRLSD